MLSGRAYSEQWPLKVPFVISRSRRTHVDVVVAVVSDGTHVGRGECQPNSRYGETCEAVEGELNAMLEPPCSFEPIDLGILRSMSARNALDCALWDLKAKQAGCRVWDLIDRPAPRPTPTVFTLSLGDPATMAAAASAAFKEGKTRLKLKFGGVGDDERLRAVRAAVPDAVLVADANEAWDRSMLKAFLPVMAGEGLAMLEQPLPSGEDAMLGDMEHPVPIVADESCHCSVDVGALAGRYDGVNIKLDKTGGLTEALALEVAASKAGLSVMVGCMLGTSLAMAPAMLLAANATFVDLDGSLLLSKDRDHKISFTDAYELLPFSADLWG